MHEMRWRRVHHAVENTSVAVAMAAGACVRTHGHRRYFQNYTMSHMRTGGRLEFMRAFNNLRQLLNLQTRILHSSDSAQGRQQFVIAAWVAASPHYRQLLPPFPAHVLQSKQDLQLLHVEACWSIHLGQDK
jgi:hypothetical protein